MTLDVNYVPKDGAFGKPYIDVDEPRRFPRPHRYVHGGFADSSTLFSFYFPAAGAYRGRFVQYLEGGTGGNDVSLAAPQDKPAAKPALMDWIYDLAFDDMGAYLVESNQGHRLFEGGLSLDNDIYTWRASTEAARFSRHLAQQIYGAAPHHGYVGGSGGGGNRTVACVENAPDVYAGGTPHVAPAGTTMPWSVQARFHLMLSNDEVKRVIDAVEPGGSGDPYAGLNAAQREVLADLYRVGWPRGAENQLQRMTHWAFQFSGLEKEDPTYFDDFWRVKGYLGADRPELLAPYLIDIETVVKRVLPVSEVMAPATLAFYRLPPDTPFGLELEVDNQQALYMSNVEVLTGEAAGRDLLINSVYRGLSALAERTPQMMRGIQPGDQVRVNNRRFIAYCHHYLYSAENPPEVRAKTGERIAQSRRPFAVDGVPVQPQRDPTGLSRAKVPVEKRGYQGKFESKLIWVSAAKDIWVWPTLAVEYAQLLRAQYGDRLDERFRFYWVENATLAPPQIAMGYVQGGDLRVWDTRLVDYMNSIGRQAFRYLSDWVEQSKPPPASTSYEFSDTNALVLPPAAAQRKGIQPVVTATVNGGKRAEVRVGQPVQFDGVVEAPPGAGTIVAAEWDFESTGEYPVRHDHFDALPTLKMSAQHRFEKPGTYFVAFRAGLHRDGTSGRGLPTHNIDRVRVVVT
jgi:hypothetical protein